MTSQWNSTVQSQWSLSSGQAAPGPLLTSLSCYDALVDFFQNESSLLLAVATEASSHPSGLDSLFAQPWVYAGGGLGNMDECPMQVCLAGGTGRDSLTFASVCIVPECDASDLASPDFSGRLETASFRATELPDADIIHEYITLHERIAQVNKFLNTGWVCGEYKVEWEIIPSIVYLGILFALLTMSVIGTFCQGKRAHIGAETWPQNMFSNGDSGEEKKDGTSSDYEGTNSDQARLLGLARSARFWSAWDMSQNMKQLCLQRPETACLDGLKVGSILWVISGHVMAIQSSSGGGYLNPGDFLPPVGVTTTLLGQLLFSSRFAVDTFLCISGFLVVHVLKRKLQYPPNLASVLSVLVFRILRILPLYGMCIGFWMFVAPHLGSGPFWYQWENFLEPCRNYWWTNLLFVNNFIPWGTPTTDTCFYHSWYLAVDVQLFFLLAPWLVLLYGRCQKSARRVTIVLWVLSVVVTAVLTYRRKWSINTFDGKAVALFDIEGYAKPHIRAQAYLAGMLVAMMPCTSRRPSRDVMYLSLALFGLALMSFITVTGAYVRRACNFEEWPSINDCGSVWRTEMTFLYTAFSRAIWSTCIAVIMYLCLEKRGRAVGTLLSWSIWTPLAQLSFGAYLIHPIVIFVWQFGGREKITFRLFSFAMDFTSISVVSFALSAVAALIIEFPCSALLRRKSEEIDDEHSSLLPPIENVPLYKYKSYGSTVDKDGHIA
jgi:peptidoglycan/LPS O-acetylase OafA/YrhL